MSNLPEFKLDEQSVGVMKDILKSKDRDQKGFVNVDELGDCLEAFGFTPDDEDLKFLQQHMDDNGDGKLEIDEILGNLEVINYHCWYGKELMQEFKNIDQDKDGIIRFPEMLKVLTTRPPNPLPALQARQLLDMMARKFDANFDGKFSYPEFVKIYMSDSLPYKNEIENGTFQPIEPEAKPKSAKPKKKRIVTSTDKSKEVSKTVAAHHKEIANSPAIRPKTGQTSVAKPRVKTAHNSKTEPKKVQ